MVKTKLISALKFHFLLAEKVCVDHGSVTQMYSSPLSSEKSLDLQQNLANGDGGQVHRRCGWKWDHKWWTKYKGLDRHTLHLK